MAIEISKNKIIINIPNSEAAIPSQHNGIKDRTVGMYYMSEISDEVIRFLSLNDSSTTFYIDIKKSRENGIKLYDYLISNDLSGSFKGNLLDMEKALIKMKSQVEEGFDFHKIKKPEFTDTYKYLKFDNEDQNIKRLRALCLGDISYLVIEKNFDNRYFVYMDNKINFFDSNNIKKIKKWFDK